jgi:hypothetical protein
MGIHGCKTAVLRIFITMVGLSTVGINFDQPRAGDNSMTLTLRSSAFSDGGEIPALYTCEGGDSAPPLAWDGIPGAARSLVLIVDDPDAPDPEAPKMTWVHWVLYNIPPHATGLPAGAGSNSNDLPSGTAAGLNDWRRTGYGGPCPPVGRHRYFFKLYALNEVLRFRRNPTKDEVETAMRGHVIEQTQLIGTYKKYQ